MLSPRDITEKIPKVLSLTGKTDNQMIRKACENCSYYSMSGLIATLWEIKKKKKEYLNFTRWVTQVSIQLIPKISIENKVGYKDNKSMLEKGKYIEYNQGGSLIVQ